MTNTQEFYGSGRGDRLIDPRFFPRAIKEFLRGESELLDAAAPFVELLVEVGCMHGRYLDWAIKRQKRYLGLDVVVKYIKQGRMIVAQRGLSPDVYSFALCGAEDISKVVHPDRQGIVSARCLIWFPFNSLGNMNDPLPVLQELERVNLPFLISSYQTHQEATACRERYYRNCGYRRLRIVTNEQGVCFLSSEGLHSMAYHPEYLQRLCTASSLPIDTVPFSRIGLAYRFTPFKS